MRQVVYHYNSELWFVFKECELSCKIYYSNKVKGWFVIQ